MQNIIYTYSEFVHADIHLYCTYVSMFDHPKFIKETSKQRCRQSIKIKDSETHFYIVDNRTSEN